jgi:hypothetical protein
MIRSCTTCQKPIDPKAADRCLCKHETISCPQCGNIADYYGTQDSIRVYVCIRHRDITQYRLSNI